MNIDEVVKMNMSEVLGQLGTNNARGSSIKQGVAYHELPFSDIAFPVHRKKLDNRLRLIFSNYNIRDKNGIDLGCNIGGFVFACQLQGARMVGYDHDNLSIAFAEKVEALKKTGAVFTNKSIDETILSDFDKKHFCIWFSQFMWLVKANGYDAAVDFMYALSKKISDVMFFETSIGDFGAGKEMLAAGIDSLEAVRNLLINNTCFQNIKFIGYPNDKWAKRPMFICSYPVAEWKGVTSIVRRISRTHVKKTYHGRYKVEGDLLKCKNNETMALKKLTSSHFPKVISDTHEREIIMDYCGVPLTKENMPSNYKLQIKEILAELRKNDIVHRDIRPGNLLVKDSVIKLIDFGWAAQHGHEHEWVPCPDLGMDFKYPNGFNDKYSLNKSINYILKNTKYLLSEFSDRIKARISSNKTLNFWSN